MATGEKVWAQAWSEPEAGSDLASLKSTAARDEGRGGWVLNGQKTWSSRAPFAHWGFGLFRSDPRAEQIGRAAGRERGCQYGEISGVAGPLNKKTKHQTTKTTTQ